MKGETKKMNTKLFKNKSVIALTLALLMVVPMLLAAAPVKAAGNATIGSINQHKPYIPKYFALNLHGSS